MQLLLKQDKSGKASQQFPEFSDVRSLVASLQPNYSVYCVRPRVLEEAVKRFIALFPGTVTYAVKCNPHPLIIDVLYRAGIREFDVASESEVAQIHNTYRDAKTHFMHPVKSRAAIKSAYWNYGVRHFAIDHHNELEKILEETGGDGVAIVVRIKTPPSEGSLYHLASLSRLQRLQRKIDSGLTLCRFSMMTALIDCGSAIASSSLVSTSMKSPQTYTTVPCSLAPLLHHFPHGFLLLFHNYVLAHTI